MMKRSSVWLDESQVDALQCLSQVTKIPIAAYLRMGIDRVLEKHKDDIFEARRIAALGAEQTEVEAEQAMADHPEYTAQERLAVSFAERLGLEDPYAYIARARVHRDRNVGYTTANLLQGLTLIAAGKRVTVLAHDRPCALKLAIQLGRWASQLGLDASLVTGGENRNVLYNESHKRIDSRFVKSLYIDDHADPKWDQMVRFQKLRKERVEPQPRILDNE